MLLADLGADVIKIEPAEGDLSREVGSQVVGEHNVYFASINRNKRSVHVDLTTAEGQATARCARADGRRAARQPAPVDDQEPRARLRVVAPLQPEDRVRRAHRLRPRRPGVGVCLPSTTSSRPGTGVAATRPVSPDGPPDARRATRRSTTRRRIMAALGLLAKVVRRRRAARSTCRSSTSCCPSCNYKAAAYFNGGDRPQRHAPRRAQLLRAGPALRDRFRLPRAVRHRRRRRGADCAQASIGRSGPTDPRFATKHARFDNREELLGRSRRASRKHRQRSGRSALRPLGIARARSPSSAMRSTAISCVPRHGGDDRAPTAGPLRVIGNPIRCADSAFRISRAAASARAHARIARMTVPSALHAS